MNKTILAFALLGGSLSFSPAQAADCSSLLQTKLRGLEVQTSTLLAAEILPPDPNSALSGSTPRPIEVGEHCLVEGVIDEREGVGGSYGTRFQLRMPTEWNGRFLFQGGGGLDGFVAPAIGSIPSTGSTAIPALTRGYAVVSMNGGHDGQSGAFGLDQQARLDFAYASIGKVTSAAKTLTEQYYGREPDNSFFMGCSNGGREAMIAAQRYPTEYDGVVVGNPGFNLTSAALAQAWDLRQFMGVAPDGVLSASLTRGDLKLVSDEIVRQCDGLDGVEDRLVNAHSQCSFDVNALRGAVEDDKLAALEAAMSGPVDAEGDTLYSDWPWDPGIETDGWRAWKLGFSETEQSDSLHVLIGQQATPWVFMTPPVDHFDPMSVDFTQLAKNISQVGALNDPTSTFLSTYADRGGKMVIFHGMADPAFSANDLSRWFREATTDTEGDFARLFLVPGMTHCGGGNGLDDFDPLTALEDWVIEGIAPEQLEATGPSHPGVSQPICAYPKEAHFSGEDPADIASYSCR